MPMCFLNCVWCVCGKWREGGVCVCVCVCVCVWIMEGGCVCVCGLWREGVCVCEIEQSSVCSAISCSFIKPTVTIAALRNSNHKTIHDWHLLTHKVTIYSS